MPHPRRWLDLKLGIIAGLLVVGAAAFILIFLRVGSLHGRKFTLYVSTDEARGVIRGTEVWLDGQRVGTVKGVEFRSPTVSEKERLLLTLSLLEDARPHVRLDTRVQVRAGGSLIGDQVVYMSSGTARSRAVTAGDTIRAGEQGDFESVTSEVALASREFPGIIENVKLLSAQLKATQSTLGALGVETNAGVKSARARAARIMSRLSDGKGSVSMALGASDLIRARAARAMAEADSIRALLASDKHSLGRFRRDSTLLGDVKHVRDELQRVQAMAASPDGTIGRLRADSALAISLHRDVASLDSLFADIKKHPLRYIAF